MNKFSNISITDIEKEVYCTDELILENPEKQHLSLSFSNEELRLRCRAIIERCCNQSDLFLSDNIAYTEFFRGNKIKAA